MNTSMRNVTALFAIFLSGVCGSPAQAADEPRVLDQTALIVSALECKAPCKNPPPHFHEAFKDWDITEGESTFKIHRKLSHARPHFFDRPWNFWNKMQKPDLHLVNGDKYPLSLENFGGADRFKAALMGQPGAEEALVANTAWPIKIEPFLFAFTVHMLENTDKSITPHAILYVPLRWDLSLPKDLGDYYALLVFHIPDDDRDCSYEETKIGEKHCLLMRRLAAKWSSGSYSEDQLTEEARKEYQYFLDHLFDGFPSPADAAELKSLQVSQISQWIERILLHNGIIHGTLGGG